MAGNPAKEPPTESLNALAIEGMSRPLSLLKNATIFQPWARERRDKLAAIVTLTDRLVTATVSLEALAPFSNGGMSRERLLNVADSCERTRLAFKEMRFPSPSKWPELAAGETSNTLSPLADMESTLDQIALAVPDGKLSSAETAAVSSKKPGLFLPDAFTNPDYLHFAIKSSAGRADLLRMLHRLQLSRHLHLLAYLPGGVAINHRRQQPERNTPLWRGRRRRLDRHVCAGLSVPQCGEL